MSKSKYDKLGYLGKREADKRMAEQYGIDLSQYGNTERPGASYSGKKEWDELSGDVANAAANDYDVRRAIEAAQASGNKKAQKLGQGISTASEAYDAQRFMEKTHKNRMDNTGNYDGANDQGNVAKYWTDKQASQYAKQGDLNKMSVDSQVEDAQTSTESDYQESDHLKQAKERVQSFRGASSAGNNDEQRNQAASGFAKYKLNLGQKSYTTSVVL